ncbi:MAG: hypothetical protein V7637_4518 [Mycobacteriales bacterium]
MTNRTNRVTEIIGTSAGTVDAAGRDGPSRAARRGRSTGSRSPGSAGASWPAWSNTSGSA